MQRKKEIPKIPRFDYVTSKAYELLFEWGITSFPITAEQILESVSDFVVCLPWSDAKKILKSNDPFNLHRTKADAKTLKRRDNNLYLVVYDDCSAYTPERVKWSILHEIGHILLGHLDDFDVTALDRGGLTKKAYGVLEVETNWFVSELLMPTPLVRRFTDITEDEIAVLFGVSEEAAGKKYERAFNKGYMYTKYDELLLRHFYHFFNTDLFETLYKRIYLPYGLPMKAKYAKICRKCESCHSYIADENAMKCFHCGMEIEITPKYPVVLSHRDKRIKLARMKGFYHPQLPYKTLHEGYKNKISKLLFCPICLNNEIEEDSLYCSICGFPTYNECTEEHIPLPFNASYCPNCGSKSTIHELYEKVEKRSLHIRQWNEIPSDEWLPYEHWEYIRMRINSTLGNEITSLPSVLFYTYAFLDDDDNIIIYADNDNAVNEIKKHSDLIIETIYKFDNINPSKVMVYNKSYANGGAI